VLRDLHRAAKDLEEEASRLGIIADGKFPMFEHGSVCLFHNDHSEWGRVRCQETYKSKAVPGRLAPLNKNYWEELDQIADLVSGLVKKPNALIGGDPMKYWCAPNDEEVARYRTLTKEVSAVFGARGIVSDDCVEFLRNVDVPDQSHVAAEAAEYWSAYVTAQAKNATYARQVQKELFNRCAYTSEGTIPDRALSRQQLVDNVRRKLLSGEIRLQEFIELQSSMAEFSISLPLPSVLDDDSENEDMSERRQDVLAKEY
jgi:hypothetical protein